MYKKGVILFDIDRTIFDTDGMIKDFDEGILTILGDPNITDFKKVEIDYMKSLGNDRYFVPDEYTKMLCTRFGFGNQAKLLNVFYGKKYEHIYKENVFPEAIEVMDIFKNKFRLGVFSEGTAKFQNHKFKSMDLNKYFDKNLVFIVDAKDVKEIVIKIPKSAVVVDDKERICEFLYKNGIMPVWLNRKDERVSDKFSTIHDLLELSRMLL